MMFDPNAIECDRCNGYGSSLAESSAKCTKCGGSGLHPVQPADVAEQHQAEQLRQLAQLRQLRQARPAPATTPSGRCLWCSRWPHRCECAPRQVQP